MHSFFTLYDSREVSANIPALVLPKEALCSIVCIRLRRQLSARALFLPLLITQHRCFWYMSD